MGSLQVSEFFFQRDVPAPVGNQKQARKLNHLNQYSAFNLKRIQVMYYSMYHMLDITPQTSAQLSTVVNQNKTLVR